MRILLTGLALCCCANAFCQTEPPSTQSLIERYTQRPALKSKVMMFPPSAEDINAAIHQKITQTYVLASGAKVNILPQDNMPCVVPEVVATMPVLRGKMVKPGEPGAMPNAR